ncbi:lipocalin family protein [Halpernia sp.]|uniref:lipocalin family protein n=1 Tax=Halpernia sp. TaxID=2782209 RepID=UPI003A90BE42
MKSFSRIALGLGLSAAAIFLLNSCAIGLPKGAEAVTNFNVNKYVGKWFEIARLDYRFEKNLDHVTATYFTIGNGDLKVDNRGFDYKKNKWKDAFGIAKFAKSPDIGELKVSFFRPFWASYNVIDIDENYKYALVIGKNTDYMWILSRYETIPDSYKQRFLAKAKSLGFKTEDLIWVNQDIKY